MLVGTPTDVDQTELLFTSLLIQATRAMTDAGDRGAGSSDRSATFRRSFLLAYATRIGERLREADRSTTASYGTELVPLLQREADAVDAEFERQFPTGPAGRLHLRRRARLGGGTSSSRPGRVRRRRDHRLKRARAQPGARQAGSWQTASRLTPSGSRTKAP